MCLDPSDFILSNNATRPPPWAFTRYLEMYLTQSQCSTDCGSCGWGHNADVIWDKATNQTGATRYMAYHSPLRSEGDFIGALKSGRRIAREIVQAQGLDTYVYSVVYPFFEQYLYIVNTCLLNTGLGLLGIFFLSMILIRNIWASVQIVATISMILGDLIGFMAMWNVTLNGQYGGGGEHTRSIENTHAQMEREGTQSSFFFDSSIFDPLFLSLSLSLSPLSLSLSLFFQPSLY